MSRKKKKQPQQTQLNLDNTLFWILLIAMVVVNLMVRIKPVEVITPNLLTGISPGLKAEMMALCKLDFLVTFTIIALVILLGKIILQRYQLQPSPLNWLLLGLLALSLLSLACADYKSLSLYGSIDRREGTLAWLCYLGLFITALNTKPPAAFTRKITWALAIVVFINLSLGLLDLNGVNVLESNLVDRLITPYGVGEHGVEGTLPNTVGNINFASGLFSALAAGFFVLALHQRTLKEMALPLILGAGSLLNLAMAKSSSGFVALFLAIPLLVLLVLTPENKKRNLAIIAVSSLLVVTMLWGAKSFYYPVYHEAVKEPLAAWQQIHMLKEKQPLPESNFETSLDLPQPQVAPGSGRLYIWNKTRELITEKPWLGYGKDTLTYHFPQNDPEKIANLATYRISVDKPHNHYLDVAFGLGIPAVLFMLTLFMYSLYRIFRYVFRASPSPEKEALAAFVLAFSSVYLLQWIFNDSVIGSAVIFWILLGLATGLTLPADKKEVAQHN